MAKTHHYLVKVDEKTPKKLSASTIESIYNQYNAYCKKRMPGCYVVEADVIGGMYWTDGVKKMVLIKM